MHKQKCRFIKTVPGTPVQGFLDLHAATSVVQAHTNRSISRLIIFFRLSFESAFLFVHIFFFCCCLVFPFYLYLFRTYFQIRTNTTLSGAGELGLHDRNHLAILASWNSGQFFLEEGDLPRTQTYDFSSLSSSCSLQSQILKVIV